MRVKAELSSGEHEDNRSVRSVRSDSSKKGKSRTPRASQADFENLHRNVSEMDKRFCSLDSKLDKLMSVVLDTAGSARQRPSNLNTVPGVSRADTVVRIPTHSIPPDILGQEEDTLSIQPIRQERSDLLGDDDDSSHTLLNGSDDSDAENNARFTKYSSKTQSLLQDMFGEDATTKSDKCKEGVSLDKAQCDVLKESWRAEKPVRISAFKDAYRTSFPVAESAEEMLSVPSLDTIVSSLLLKRLVLKPQ
ncbi:hypothetical protein DPMN_029153 [Dreissena polymorpha]|uniref:Uncharacterized protein n=1 Tax=Dreissena polymorpha TaxID=45954 RepID=A0A9D4RH43_DREPO|nr:hypothetical protein DPMN_029153 [Dreissena polymorpha]